MTIGERLSLRAVTFTRNDMRRKNMLSINAMKPKSIKSLNRNIFCYDSNLLSIRNYKGFVYLIERGKDGILDIRYDDNDKIIYEDRSMQFYTEDHSSILDIIKDKISVIRDYNEEIGVYFYRLYGSVNSIKPNNSMKKLSRKKKRIQ